MLSFFVGLLNFLWSTIYLFVIFPLTVVFETAGWLWSMIGYSVLFANLIVAGVLGLGLARYHQDLVVYPEYFVRCVVNPIVTDIVLPLFNLFRSGYNPIICWWDAVNWFFFGFFNQVLGPDAVQCGAATMLVDLGCVFTQFFDSFLVFLGGGKFLTGFYDMSKLSAAIVQFVTDWQTMLCCLCEDICCLWVVIPFPIPGFPFPPPINVVSILFPEYYFWQAIESVINTLAALLQILWPLLLDLLYLTPPSARPDFSVVASYACQAIERASIAVERTAQRIWDRFVPWYLNFQGMLQAPATLLCMAVDLAEILLTVFVNVDIIVFNMFTPWPNTYVGPPYTLPLNVWNTTVRTMIVRFMNSVAPVSDPNFYVNVQAVYNRTTLSAGVCTILTRIICDWDGTDTPCFNQDPNFASMYNTGGFLQNYNFCCITNNLGVIIADFLKGLYEMFLHTTSANDWFGWLDGMNDIQQLVVDIVALADCIFSLLDFVPVVGYCLKQLFVQLINFALSLIAFLLKVVIALGTMTYDIPSGLTSRNFLFQGDAAITQWEQVVFILNGDTPSSLINCLRYILNYGVQIPPITLDSNGHFVTCPAPECVPVDFIPPPPIIARATAKGILDSVGDESHLNMRFGLAFKSRVTPILSYEIEEELRKNTTMPWFHPVFLKERLFPSRAEERYAAKNIPSVIKNIDALFETKKREFWERYRVISKCQADDAYKASLRQTDPWRYRWLKSMNRLPDTSHCIDMGAYDNVIPGRPAREQRHVFLRSSERFGLWPDVSLSMPNTPIWSPHLGGGSYMDTLERNMSRYQTFFVSGVPEEGLDNAFAFLPPSQPQTQEQQQHQETDDETASSSSSTVAAAFHTAPPLFPDGRLIPPPPPLTTQATNAPIAGCPAPGQPHNPCFDLACLPAAVVNLVGEVLLFVGHLLDGLIRGDFPDTAAGEVPWGYFIGNNCTLRCFEKDIENLVLDAVQLLTCTCHFLNLILPSSPQFPQPDFCCALVFAGDLIANTIQVIINGIKSLALDSPRFIYFNNGYFVRDVDELFAETLQIISCLCQFVRYVFPISQLTGGTIYGGGAFDICCIPMVLADTAIELLKLILLIIINLATIEGTGIDFWRVNPNQPSISQIGFIQQVNVTLFTFFGENGGICSGAGKPQGIGGLSSCVCQILDLILPIRQDPGAPISDTNCPFFDVCCLVRGIGYVISDTLLFLFETLASLWQSWAPQDNNRCGPVGPWPPGVNANTPCSNFPNLPYAFLDFFFCHELTPAQFKMMMDAGELTPYEILQQQKCGKFLPIIDEFTNLISTCPCQFFSLVDMWLSLAFGHTIDCFCGQVDGVLTNIGDLVNAVLVAVVTLIRRVADPTYWQPFGPPGQGGANNGFTETNTWTWNFFAPMIDSLCNLVSASTCFLDIFLPFCEESRKRIVKSAVRWILEIIILIGAFIEGFVGLFTSPAGCLAPGQTQSPTLNPSSPGVCPTGSSFHGVSIEDLSTVFIAIFALPINALFADSSVVCSILNPPQCPMSNPCCCYDDPVTGDQLFTFVTTGPVFSEPGYQCAQCVGPNMCTSYIDSYAYKTCAPIGAPQQHCFEDCTQSVGNSQTGCLVSCDLQNPGLTKLDGIVMAYLRYFQCLLVQIFPPFGFIIQGIVIMVSILWQLTNPLIRVLAAIIMFVLSLFTAFFGGCDCYGNSKNYQNVNGLCYQCLEIWPDNNAMCTFTKDYTLPFITFAYPAGTSFMAGTTVRCRDLGHSANCLAGGHDSGQPTNVSVSHPGATNICADSTYQDVIHVTNNANPNTPSNLIFTDSLYGKPGPSICCAANIIPSGFQPGNTACPGPGGITGGVTCGIIQLIQNFFSIFTALLQVFSQGPVIPNQPTFRGILRNSYSSPDAQPARGTGQMRWQPPLETRKEFRERMKAGQTRERYLYLKDIKEGSNVVRGQIQYNGANPPLAIDGITAFFEAVWGFFTDDCMADYAGCMCRNWGDMPGELCSPQALAKKGTMDVTVPIINHVASTMTGMSPCDHHLRAFNGTGWEDIWISDRVYYVDCVERALQGGRMNDIYPSFPADYYYRHDGGLLLLNNLVNEARANMRDEHVRVMEERSDAIRKKRDAEIGERQRMRLNNPAGDIGINTLGAPPMSTSDVFVTRQDLLRRQASDRKARLTYMAARHPRWKKSFIASAMIDIDMMEWKARSGYYTTLAKDFSANLADGVLPKFTFYERFSMVRNHAATAGSNVLSVQWRRAFSEILKGITAIPEAYARVSMEGPLAIYQEGMKRYRERPEEVARMKEMERKRDILRNAFYMSPVYRWWTGNTTVTVGGRMNQNTTNASESPTPPTPYINPIKRLVLHLQHVFAWQRANWDKRQPTLITADLHLRNNLATWFSKRWKTTWTRQKLANWQAAGRLLLRLKEGFFPGTVSREMKSRFSIGPGCVITYKRSAPESSSMLYYENRLIDLNMGIGLNCSDPSKFAREPMPFGRGGTRKHWLWAPDRPAPSVYGDGDGDGDGDNAGVYRSEMQRRLVGAQQSPVLSVGDQLILTDRQDLFLIGDGCLLMQGFLDELVFLVNYCANDFMPQLPPYKRDQLAKDSSFWWFMNEMAERGRAIFDDPGPHTQTWPTPQATDADEWSGWLEFFKTRGLTWSRPKVHTMESPSVRWRREFRQAISNQQWMRAVMTTTFSFQEWLLMVFDDWTGLSLSMDINSIFATIDEFVYNENEDWYAGPVGLKYWALFFVRCYFKPPAGMLPQNAAINLNCKVGIGLEAAIGWVTSIMVIVFLTGSIFLPWVLIPLQIIPLSLLWLIIMPTVAYHYSPRCWLMTPSLLLPGVGASGISVPYWPFKIAFPALPFCLMDDLAALITKYTQMCICEVWWGTWLEFICPRCMIPGGNGCPTCPQKLSFYNCQQLGLSDGLQNVFYLLLQTVPEAGNVIKGIAQSIFFNGAFGPFLGSVGDYLTTIVDSYTNITPDQQCQYWYCFGVTLPAGAWYILILVILVTFATLCWNILVLLLLSLWSWIMAGPLPYLWPGVVPGTDPYSGLTGLQADVSSDPYVPVKIGNPATAYVDPATGTLMRPVYARLADIGRDARRNMNQPRGQRGRGQEQRAVFSAIDHAYREWGGAIQRFVRAAVADH